MFMAIAIDGEDFGVRLATSVNREPKLEASPGVLRVTIQDLKQLIAMHPITDERTAES
jgi:hypothetical protein